jgi:hypothetical protein
VVDNCLVLQNYKDFVKCEPSSYGDSCIISDDDGKNQVIDIKLEGDIHLDVEQNPVPVMFTLIKSELEVSFFVSSININRYRRFA